MFDSGMFGGGLLDLLEGMFRHSDKPYQQNQDYLQKGLESYGPYKEWLEQHKNPNEFVNNLMGDYSESPYAHNLQQQSLRAGQNAASASGLSGSTPLMQQLQQNAGNITSQDQNQWLQNVLGVDTNYGNGQKDYANSLNSIYGNMGENSYNQNTAKQNDFWKALGGGFGMFGGL